MASLLVEHHPTMYAPTRTTQHPIADQVVNVLLTTFAGLGLPRTLSLPVKSSTSIHDTVEAIYNRLPPIDHSLIITTTSNKQLLYSNDEPVHTLLSNPQDTFLPLRLSIRLCGGKGGFGSQLRAAGGRMSSRKNRNQNQNPNGSNRNLDGRRLRTVDAAKRLAEYLATKPGMEEKEREEQKKRWRQVVENADKTAEEIRSGKRGAGQGRLDAEYVEGKADVEEKTREAVVRAMREGMLEVERTGSESSMDADEDESDENVGAEEGSSASSEEMKPQVAQSSAPAFYGWDDQDEDDDEDDDDDPVVQAQATYEGKGKGKAA